MTRQPVKSTAITSIGFEDNCIECEMPNGTLYRYPDCTLEDFQDLLGAESIGKHFSKHFRPRPFTKTVPAKVEV